jgi:histidyl-tRNA synthetase
MQNIKPSLTKGTRDFGPAEMAKRNYLFDVLRDAFQRFGFMPLETPAMENLSTLTGKYGEEGDQLIFKILNSGDYLAGNEINEKTTSKNLLPGISEKALRYDLTVPFARYVVMNQHQITFPFRRYQIQPVWRADRPQKGRYREFFQCDTDIIGSDSLINELDLILLLDDVFSHLGLRVCIKLNNRKILSGLALACGDVNSLNDICVAIDKLDKIGKEKVLDELRNKNFSEDVLAKINGFLDIANSPGISQESIDKVYQVIGRNEWIVKGLAELKFIFESVDRLRLKLSSVEFDATLARGLNYYTGAIIEVKVNEPGIDYKGSIGGGGRYDDLTGIFGKPGLSGVGVSFGADRIYDVLQELNLFPDGISEMIDVLFVNFGGEAMMESIRYVSSLRAAGISAMVYPDEAKIKKQFAYADDVKVPYVVIIGEDELAKNEVVVKDMKNGTQQNMSFNLLLRTLQS